MTTTISGTSGVTFPAGGTGNPAGTVVGTTDTQTLTNKTLTSPTMSGAVVSAMASSVITSGTAQASTSGTSIDFTSIPSWVKRITVMFSGVSLSGTDSILVRLGTSSGVETTGYTGSSFFTYDGGSINTNVFSTGFIATASGGGSAAGTVYVGQVIISKLDGNSWVMSGSVFATTSTATARIATSAGAKTTASTLDRVSILTSGTNTFDAGSINILYE